MSISHLARTRPISHLLLTGHNPFSPPSSTSQSSSSRQSPSNPSLTPVPFSTTWLSQLGREVDTYSGPSLITSISSSNGHSLLNYKNYSGFDRIVGMGRNESGQLGIGFASQEGTRGLVEGFEGEKVLKVKTCVQASYLLIKRDDTSNSLYSIGNLSRGKLSQPNYYSRSESTSTEVEEHDEPVMKILPRATLVDTESFIAQESGTIVQIETGYEHLLLLTESGDLYGTGCNTDGQLGLSHSRDVYQLTKIPLPESINSREGGIERIVAGGDTSGFITKSGKLFTWGNSEYAQAGHGKKIDQIVSPLYVNAQETFLEKHGGRRIVDYQCGGSFGVLLDDRNNVYTTGYGALGHYPSTSSSSSSSSTSPPNLYNPTPTLIPSLSSTSLGFTSPITRIRASYGYAVAISDRDQSRDDEGGGGKLFSWGINNKFGRLGLGSISRIEKDDSSQRGMKVEPFVLEPREVEIPLREMGLLEENERREEKDWKLGEIELGDEGMWVEIREEIEV